MSCLVEQPGAVLGGDEWTSQVRRTRALRPRGMDCARTDGLDEKSGMTRECHVPFCGSLGVRIPGATRLRDGCMVGAGVADRAVRAFRRRRGGALRDRASSCLLYTSDAADEEDSV